MLCHRACLQPSADIECLRWIQLQCTLYVVLLAHASVCEPATYFGRSINCATVVVSGERTCKILYVARCMLVSSLCGAIACRLHVVYLVYMYLVCDFMLSSIFICERCGSIDELLLRENRDKSTLRSNSNSRLFLLLFQALAVYFPWNFNKKIWFLMLWSAHVVYDMHLSW